MTLRGRLTIVAVAIVGAILLASAAICFAVMRSELRGQIDDSLRVQARLARDIPSDTAVKNRLPLPPRQAGGVAPYVQRLSPTGQITRPAGETFPLPIESSDLAVARGERQQFLDDRHARETHVRVLTTPLSGGGAIQLGRSLASVDSALARLRVLLFLLVLGGVAAAGVLSRLFSRQVVAPITALTDAAGHIQATGDLRKRVENGRTDEVGRLASSFNAMLDRVSDSHQALEASTHAQRQLVADASHELRTPIASLRTNVEVMQTGALLDERDRNALLADVVEQTDELTALVGDLIELARGDQPVADDEDIDFAAIVKQSLDRTQRHALDMTFVERLEPWPMSGSRERLTRAVNNVLENAAKFSPPGSTVEVRLVGGVLTVRDQGQGVPEDELPHLFDRFYRARNAADRHGSGLGLAIVKQVVEAHQGQVRAELADGGGLKLAIDLSGA